MLIPQYGTIPAGVQIATWCKTDSTRHILLWKEQQFFLIDINTHAEYDLPFLPEEPSLALLFSD